MHERLHALLRRGDDGVPRLCAPRVGVWEPLVAAGDAVEPGRLLGVLRVLRRRVRVLAPDGASGVVAALPAPAGGAARGAVDYGAPLLELGEGIASPRAAAAGGADPSAPVPAGERTVRAPTHGVFYARPSPDAPPFVSPGERVQAGRVVGLVEVMKTFNPVRYADGDPDAPEAVVQAVLAAERQEVEAGQALVVLRGTGAPSDP